MGKSNAILFSHKSRQALLCSFIAIFDGHRAFLSTIARLEAAEKTKKDSHKKLTRICQTKEPSLEHSSTLSQVGSD